MTRKIEVLKKAVKALENGIEYNWGDSCSCNCGIVAQQCLNINKQELHSKFYINIPGDL